jgi:hypothetical protein
MRGCYSGRITHAIAQDRATAQDSDTHTHTHRGMEQVTGVLASDSTNKREWGLYLFLVSSFFLFSPFS